MITIKEQIQRNVNEGCSFELYGLSTDEKPLITYNHSNIANASVFYEMDTKTVYMYNAEDHEWLSQA